MSTLERLPEMVSVKDIVEEMGQTRAFAEAIMRHVPVFHIPDFDKKTAKRSDVLAFIDQHTLTKDQVPPQ